MGGGTTVNELSEWKARDPQIAMAQGAAANAEQLQQIADLETAKASGWGYCRGLNNYRVQGFRGIETKIRKPWNMSWKLRIQSGVWE